MESERNGYEQTFGKIDAVSIPETAHRRSVVRLVAAGLTTRRLNGRSIGREGAVDRWPGWKR